MNLYQASSQWATRPADERFGTVRDLHDAVTTFYKRAVERQVPWGELSVKTDGDALQCVGPAGVPARFTHWSFGQLAARVGAPSGYLRTLPSPVVAQCLTVGMQQRGNGDRASLLLSRGNGDETVTVHALLTEKYARIWDHEVTDRLLRLEAEGWKVPPARPALPDQPGARVATEADCLSNSRAFSQLAIKPGDWIAPAGLYASDHDVFAFMVREDRVIDAGEGRALNRGFFVWNSEVGAASFGIMTFLYDAICGNHIVWGASEIKKVRLRHVGSARERMGYYTATLKTYADGSASKDAAVIANARRYILGSDRERVLDAIMGKRLSALTQGVVSRAYALAEANAPAEGDPNTLWGMVNGLTRASQEVSHTDTRVEIDRAAGKLLELVF